MIATTLPHITPDAEAEDLRTTVRVVLSEHADREALFRDDTSEPEWPTWSLLTGEVGVVGLDVPERYGGAGATFREVSLVGEELGRALARLPWLSTAVLGVGVLLHATGEGAEAARVNVLPRLISGGSTATLAYREQPQGRNVTPIATTAQQHGCDWLLTGQKTMVVEGCTADLIFVSASTTRGQGLFLVEAGAAGLDRTPMRVMDHNRQLARVTLNRTPAQPVGDPHEAGPVLEKVLDRAVSALAGEQLGGAAAALDMATKHAAQRIQFGRPIATFQAIKHRCADMLVEVEAARSAALWAAAVAADEPESLPTAASAAALCCSAAYRFVSEETIQVHGGIGFTWEHYAHLHFRRATTSAVLFGSQHEHRERLLATVGV